MDNQKMRMCARLAAACLMTLIGVSPACAADKPKPDHGTVEANEAPSMPMLNGNFFRAGSGDMATLMRSTQKGMTDQYMLVVMPSIGSGQIPKLVTNIGGKGPNPPQLSLIKPGSYKPVCHDGGRCEPVKIANEAISLCFGEASCEIVYFNGSAFRELVVTD